MVYQQTTCGHACQSTMLTTKHSPNIVVIANTANHRLSTSYCRPNIFSVISAKLLTPTLRNNGSAVIHHHFMPGARQMPGHVIAHIPQPQESNTHKNHLFNQEKPLQKILQPTIRRQACKPSSAGIIAPTNTFLFLNHPAIDPYQYSLHHVWTQFFVKIAELSLRSVLLFICPNNRWIHLI